MSSDQWRACERKTLVRSGIKGVMMWGVGKSVVYFVFFVRFLVLTVQPFPSHIFTPTSLIPYGFGEKSLPSFSLLAKNREGQIS